MMRCTGVRATPPADSVDHLEFGRFAVGRHTQCIMQVDPSTTVISKGPIARSHSEPLEQAAGFDHCDAPGLSYVPAVIRHQNSSASEAIPLFELPDSHPPVRVVEIVGTSDAECESNRHQSCQEHCELRGAEAEQSSGPDSSSLVHHFKC